jgi:DNA-directed RNA polymerase specialized sigma24 family protein
MSASPFEEFQRQLARLPSDELRAIALGKMEGHTNAEIAARLGCTDKTVERRLKLIRDRWKEAVDGA